MEKHTIYQPELLAPTQTPDPLTAIWHSIAPAITPETVIGIILTLAITHSLKVIAAATVPQVTSSLIKWRSFCTILSTCVGSLVGLAVWIAGGSIATLLACAFLSGPVWRLILAVAPERIAAALMTETDRSFK